jgi:hypothetical protein
MPRSTVAEELMQQMTRWGHAQATRYAANDDGPSHGDSVLAKQADLGLRYKGRREKERKPLGRCGEDRRRFMAKKLAEQSEGRLRLGILPMWSVDPIPSKNDASPPRDLPRARVDLGVPDELRWIDRAISQLWREAPIRALVMRIEFTTAGTHRMKAARVSDEYGGAITVRQYRYELTRALDWMLGRMAA